PGPFATSCVRPSRRAVSVPVAGSNAATDESLKLHVTRASGTGVLSPASGVAWNRAVAVTGTATSALARGNTANASTARCTRISSVLVCRRPATVSVAAPGPTARTTPTTLTWKTPGLLDCQLKARG